jgi:photosystem II stability/assembly factor-like uncharacterized protein
LIALLGIYTVHASSSADSVDYHKFELDSSVRDIMWCGNKNEAILVLSEKGSVYRSRDRGTTWKKLQNVFKKTAESVADDGQQVTYSY